MAVVVMCYFGHGTQGRRRNDGFCRLFSLLAPARKAGLKFQRKKNTRFQVIRLKLIAGRMPLSRFRIPS